MGAVTTTVPVNQVGHFITIDITVLAQSWVQSPSSNHGISLTASAADPSTYVLFDSEENEETGHQPRLDIILSGIQGPAGPQGATGVTGPQGLIGLTGATGLQGPIGTIAALSLWPAQTIKKDLR